MHAYRLISTMKHQKNWTKQLENIPILSIQKRQVRIMR